MHVGLEVRGRQERPRPLGRASRDVLSSRGPIGAPRPLRPTQFPSDRAGGSSELSNTHSQTAPCRQHKVISSRSARLKRVYGFHFAQPLSPGVEQDTGVTLGT